MNISPSWLEVEEGMGGARPVLNGTADEMRGQFAGLLEFLAPLYPKPSDAVSTRDALYEGIKYRLYSPRGVTKAAEVGLPVGVYFHGGGFVLGDLDTEDGLCRAIAEGAGALIVSVDYRLAPASKAPAQLQDAIKLFEWAHHQAAVWGGDPNRLFTIGTSAGGALALAVARKIGLGHTALPKNAVNGIVAFNPVLLHPSNVPAQYTPRHTSHNESRDNTPIIDLGALNSFFDLCNVDPDDADYFVGLDSTSHIVLPPAYIVTCGWDPVRDDGKVLAESMESHGIRVKKDHYDGLPHCFWMFPTLPESVEFVRNAIQGVQWVVGNM